MTDSAVEIRDAEAGEIGRLARLWYDSWQDAHAKIVPVELPRLRTVERLEERLAAMLPSVRVVDLSGEPAGLCAIKGDELYLLYVSAKARGSGVAAGSRALSETTEPRDSMRSGSGTLSGPKSNSWTRRMETFPSRSGATRSA
jgi:hypothetical protein